MQSYLKGHSLRGESQGCKALLASLKGAARGSSLVYRCITADKVNAYRLLALTRDSLDVWGISYTKYEGCREGGMLVHRLGDSASNTRTNCYRI